MLKTSIRLWTQQLFCNRKSIRAKDCLLQFGREKNRINYLRRSVRFINILVSANSVEIRSLLTPSFFGEQPIIDAFQKFHLGRWTDLLQSKIALLFKELNFFF